MLFSGCFMEDWGPHEKRETKFVFIGKDLNRDELINGFLACKVTDPELRFNVGEAACLYVHVPVWRITVS